MAYYMYMGDTLLPVTPNKLQLKINGQDKTLVLINEGEVNILKKAKLTDISFDALLPNVRHPFAQYPHGFQRAAHYLDKLEKWKQGQKPFQFIVTRTLPDGTPLFDTNLTCSVADYTLKEDTKTAFDVVASIKLKQYRGFVTKTFTIVTPQTAPGAVEQRSGMHRGVPAQAAVGEYRRAGVAAPEGAKLYTVQRDGETVWEVARRQYGSDAEYQNVLQANADKAYTPNNLAKGEVLYLPPATTE